MSDNQPLDSKKLTKTFFLGLPEGVYLVSSCYDTLGLGRATPVFNEYVVPSEERNAQWNRVKVAGADQRLCDVYRDAEHYKRVVQFRTIQSTGYPSIIISEPEEDVGGAE